MTTTMRFAIQSHGVRDGEKFTSRDGRTYATREEAEAALAEREAEDCNNPNSEIVEVYACYAEKPLDTRNRSV